MPAPHTTGSLAKLLEATLDGPADLPIKGVEAISLAQPGQLTFIRSAEFGHQWASSRASAALVSPGVSVSGHDAKTRALLLVSNADLAMIRALEIFAPPFVYIEPGVHPTAVVDESARIGGDVSIGPHCFVGAGARIGDRAKLDHNVTIGPEAEVGADSVLRAGVVVLARCTVGDRCILHPGVVIGADGFGFRPTPDGRGLVKVPHNGYVRVEDDVEIGANSCVDRGKFGPTVVGAGTKIDNLVQIAHNVIVGKCCLLCAGTAIAGSSKIGDYAMLGGQVGVADASVIAPGAIVGAQTGIHRDIGSGTWLGTPARPAKETGRIYAALGKLDELIRRVRALESAARRPEGPKA